MKSLLFFALALGCSQAALVTPSVKLEFAKFQQEFGKQYRTQSEREKRLRIFEEEYLEVQRHNAIPGVSYLKGINKFSDLTEKEFVERYLGSRHDEGYLGSRLDKGNDFGPHVMQSLNKTYETTSGLFNWQNQGFLTPIKDQKDCRSCWAQAAVAQIESYYKINGQGPLTEFSVQQVVSCDKKSNGCDGGRIIQAYNYVNGYGGLTSQAEFPYEAKELKCPGNSTKLVNVNYYTKCDGKYQVKLQLKKRGPLGVLVDASRWKPYKSGIFDGCGNSKSLNHAVQVVGYYEPGPTDKRKGFWIVRNSWGDKWGEDGFIRVFMKKGEGDSFYGLKGTCGIYTFPSFPSVTKI